MFSQNSNKNFEKTRVKLFPNFTRHHLRMSLRHCVCVCQLMFTLKHYWKPALINTVPVSCSIVSQLSEINPGLPKILFELLKIDANAAIMVLYQHAGILFSIPQVFQSLLPFPLPWCQNGVVLGPRSGLPYELQARVYPATKNGN